MSFWTGNKGRKNVAPRADLLATPAAEDERETWRARLAAESPEQRLKTAREHLLFLGAYGYDINTGMRLHPSEKAS